MENSKSLEKKYKDEKGWKINLYPSTQLLEESKLLVQCVHPWCILQHIEKSIICLPEYKSFGAVVWNGKRQREIIKIAVQSSCHSYEKITDATFFTPPDW